MAQYVECCFIVTALLVGGHLLMTLTVFQSAPLDRPAWIDRCMASVRSWAALQGWSYQFMGDEIFDLVAPDLRAKLRDRTPILADLARLELMQQHLDQEGGRALWIDADSLVLNPHWSPALDSTASFGQEFWVQDNSGSTGWRHYQSPHNAFMSFSAGSPILPFLRYTATNLLERVDIENLAPQFVGPQLLKALHNLCPFTLHEQAGALSPALASELATEPGTAVEYYREKGGPVLSVVNLCQSLVGSQVSAAAISDLIDQPQRLLALSSR